MEDINNAPVFTTDDKLDKGFVNWFKALSQVPLACCHGENGEETMTAFPAAIDLCSIHKSLRCACV